MDAADGDGFVLAGSPEEADRIDLAAFGEPSTVANVLEDAAKLAALGLILAALTITATGAAEWLERL